MDVFVCLDDRGGMFFNHRRQSRDREVIQDMLDSLDGKPLYIRTLTVYRWNRRYPADVFLDVDLSGWRRVSCWEFPGHSHERISKEVYCP